jgi:hypothetical protein
MNGVVLNLGNLLYRFGMDLIRRNCYAIFQLFSNLEIRIAYLYWKVIMDIQTNFYRLTPYVNLLNVEAFSYWDERVAKQFQKDLATIVFKLYRDTFWGILIDNRKWGLHTPDSEKFIRAWTQAKTVTPLTHQAIVVGQSELKKWQLNNLFNDNNGFKTKIFEDIEDAINWLASCGYTMEPLIP